MIWFD